MMMQMSVSPVFGMSPKDPDNNPLLVTSALPYGAPDFNNIKTTDWLPAFQVGIQQQRDNINRIVTNKRKAAFKNTILAFEESGATLERVTNIFFCLTSAHKTTEIAEIEKKVVPMLKELENEISFNKPLFQRVKYVYDHEYSKLKGEDKKLLEETYKRFVRSGALLSDGQTTWLMEIFTDFTGMSSPDASAQHKARGF